MTKGNVQDLNLLMLYYAASSIGDSDARLTGQYLTLACVPRESHSEQRIRRRWRGASERAVRAVKPVHWSVKGHDVRR